MSIALFEQDRPRSPRDRLVFALDVDHIDEASKLVNRLARHVGMFKVGPRLFSSAGHDVLDLIQAAGSQVFLDLKFHDIPASVAAAAAEIARQRVKIFTVHAMGGARMFEAINAEISQITLIPGVSRPICLGVTVLTSHRQADLKQLGIEMPIVDMVTRLAKLAMDSGAGGVVASGHELPALKAILPPETVFMIPGIRQQGSRLDDQVRVMSAGDAIRAGATYLVVGRPIRQSKDPVGTAEALVEEIAAAEADLAKSES